MRMQHLLTGLILIHATLFAAPSTVAVEEIDISAGTGTVDLLIKTSAKASYQAGFSSNDELKLRIDDATGYEFTRSDNPLWAQVPFKDISIAQFYDNVYLTIGTATKDKFQLTHSATDDGIRLSFRGDVFKNSVSNMPEKSLEIKSNKILHNSNLKQDKEQLNLDEQMEMAIQNDDMEAVQLLHAKYHNTAEIPEHILKPLAAFYEYHEMYGRSEELWFRYYRTEISDGNTVYAEELPESQQVKVAQSTMENGIVVQAKTFVGENKISLAIFLVLSFVTSGGYWVYTSRQTGEDEEALSESASKDFLSALQSSMAAGKTEQDYASDGALSEEAEKSQAKKQNSDGKSDASLVNSTTIAKQKSEQKTENTPGRKRREATRLHRMGLSVEMIARELELSHGEVELLLKITDQGSTKPKANRVADESLAGKSPEEIARNLHISVEEAKLLRMRQSRG